jgi:hypothetical protein
MSNQRDSMRLRYLDSLGERSSATTPAAALGGPVFVVDGVAAPRSQPGILLLDDDTFMLGVQSRMLLDRGYAKVSTAGSAQAALLMLQREKQTKGRNHDRAGPGKLGGARHAGRSHRIGRRHARDTGRQDRRGADRAGQLQKWDIEELRLWAHERNRPIHRCKS